MSLALGYGICPILLKHFAMFTNKFYLILKVFRRNCDLRRHALTHNLSSNELDLSSSSIPSSVASTSFSSSVSNPSSFCNFSQSSLNAESLQAIPVASKSENSYNVVSLSLFGNNTENEEDEKEGNKERGEEEEKEREKEELIKMNISSESQNEEKSSLCLKNNFGEFRENAGLEEDEEEGENPHRGNNSQNSFHGNENSESRLHSNQIDKPEDYDDDEEEDDEEDIYTKTDIDIDSDSSMSGPPTLLGRFRAHETPLRPLFSMK
ncbi:hypothetical protein Anas_12216, partial [Armadillidium nasatum]